MAIRDVPHFEPTTYHAQPMDESIRAFRDDVMSGLTDPNRRLIDVRSPQEYTGELIHMVNYPQEGAQRGGHIPTAKSIPWATAANPDGTFRSAEELRQIYEGKDIGPGKDVVTYCRIGERSAHTWFVLTRSPPLLYTSRASQPIVYSRGALLRSLCFFPEGNIHQWIDKKQLNFSWIIMKIRAIMVL